VSPRELAVALFRSVTRLFPIALVSLTCLSQLALAQQTLGSINDYVAYLKDSNRLVEKVYEWEKAGAQRKRLRRSP
jgi:hypothetical protein